MSKKIVNKSSKLRNRTSEELYTRKIEFLKICEILDDLNIEYFLQTGILLGAIRNNNFIPWDWDIEISVFSEKFYPQIDIVAERLKKNNFTIQKIVRIKNEVKIDFLGKYPENVTGYTIFGWNYSSIKDQYWRNEFIVPSKFLKKFSKLFFFGREFNCPYNPQEYLTYAYGNWKIPLRTTNKEDYFSKVFKNKNLFLLNQMKKKIYKFIYLILKNLKILR